MNKQRRKFLKTAWGAIIVFGGSMVGIPLGCKTENGQDSDDLFQDLLAAADLPEEEARIRAELRRQEIARRYDLAELTEEDLARYPEMTPEEVDEFVAEIEERQQDLIAELDAQGKPKLPPGQHVVDVIPVMKSNPSPRTIEDWKFHLTGEVENEFLFNWEQFQALPFTSQISDLHCVTGWSMLDVPVGGVRMKDLIEMAQPTGKAKHVITDCEHGYTTNITLADALQDDVLICTTMFSDPLLQKYGGPARGMIPFKYYYKSGKWATGLRLTEIDEPGYWETKGYSNTADPWSQDRYS